MPLPYFLFVIPGMLCYNILTDKLEFGGESPLTMRHELRRPKKTISRPVASIRSAYGIRQT